MVVTLLAIPTVLACSVPPAKIELNGEDSKDIEFTFSTCETCTTCPQEAEDGKWHLRLTKIGTGPSWVYVGSLAKVSPKCSDYNTVSCKNDAKYGTYEVKIWSHDDSTYSYAKFKYDNTGITMIEGWTHHNCQEVPEFATAAIPIATMLGLVYIFYRRKRKE